MHNHFHDHDKDKHHVQLSSSIVGFILLLPQVRFVTQRDLTVRLHLLRNYLLRQKYKKKNNILTRMC